MSDVSSATKFFPVAKEAFSTTTSGAVSSGATTVGLSSVSGFANGDTVVLVIDPTDSVKKQVFTGVVDTANTQITGVVWTEGTNQAHTAGATVVDYETATHWSLYSKGLLVQHTQDGKHANTISTNTINENTADTGVTADGVLLKDNEVLLNNNKGYKAKNSSGTAKELMRLDDDDYLRLGQLPRQDNTTNATQENQLIQFGWGFVAGAGSSTVNDTVTFPATYASAPVVFIASLNELVGSDPTAIGDLTAESGSYAQAGDITTSGFVATVLSRDAASSLGATVRYGYSWIAIGTKA